MRVRGRERERVCEKIERERVGENMERESIGENMEEEWGSNRGTLVITCSSHDRAGDWGDLVRTTWLPAHTYVSTGYIAARMHPHIHKFRQ